MAQLSLTCFGEFHVVLAGQPLTAFPTDKVRALLVYLAVEGQAQQRNALAQLLWPGYSEESANNSIRQTIHRLRQLLHDATANPPWLLITRQTVQFNPAASLSVDAATFTQLIHACSAHAHTAIATCPPCLDRLQQAVALYHGDFLAGFTVADSDPFEEWRRITQEQFHLYALDAFTHLADAAEATGDTETALQTALRQVTVEPWLETAHRRIMRLLAQRGQRVAASAQYQRCCAILAEELGARPEVETTKLHEQIQSGIFDKERDQERGRQEGKEVNDTLLTPAPLPVTIPHNLPAVLTPLIGRARELADIGARLQQAGVRLSTLVGAGGMGKTRLALAVAQQILDSRFLILASDTPPTETIKNQKSRIS